MVDSPLPAKGNPKVEVFVCEQWIWMATSSKWKEPTADESHDLTIDAPLKSTFPLHFILIAPYK